MDVIEELAQAVRDMYVLTVSSGGFDGFKTLPVPSVVSTSTKVCPAAIL